MPINRSDKPLEVKAGSLDASSMRYHELWLQRWLSKRFFVREGYSIPCVFATPMDAFSLFSKLWADENNPFAYLFDLKDEHGTPLYEPHPSPIRYPLISVSRQGIKLRPYQNFSIHRWRHVAWPTVSETVPIPGKEQQGTDLTKCDLGEVMTSRMPMAFDYQFQIDHFCLRPDTQAFFIEKLLNQFWRTGGGVLQTWMDIEYPGWGQQYIRMYLAGDVDNRPPDESTVQDKNAEYKTSFTVVVEGFSIDLAYETVPALWKLILTSAKVDQLDKLLFPQVTIDLKTKGTNLVLDSRPDIPPTGPCQTEGVIQNYYDNGTLDIYLGDPAVPPNPGDNITVPGPDTGGNLPPGYFPIEPKFAYGIESTLVFGYPTLQDFPPVVVTLVEPFSGTLSISTFGSLYNTVPDIVAGDMGTNAGTFAMSFGNINEYALYNFTDPGTLTTVGFGTHFFALVGNATGTNSGTYTTTTFGTHMGVTVFVDAGTDFPGMGGPTPPAFFLCGTYSAETFGTHLQVVQSTDAGTNAGTYTFETFGTYLQVTVDSGTFSNPGTLSAVAFGAYTAA